MSKIRKPADIVLGEDSLPNRQTDAFSLNPHFLERGKPCVSSSFYKGLSP